MPDKGRIMSQTYYERQSKLIELYKEAFRRKETCENDTVMALRTIGFSELMAANRVREWAVLSDTYEQETDKAKKRRHRQQASLEKYVFTIMLDKKYFNEENKKYMNEHKLLKAKYKKKELLKDDCVRQLIQSGYSKEFAGYIVDKWETER